MSQIQTPKTLWELLYTSKNSTRIMRYMRWLHRRYQVDFREYSELYQWSVDNSADFWESIWQYFKIKSYTPYEQVLSNDAMPHTRWFTGATLNYAEHILNGRTDFSPAIKFLSEDIAKLTAKNRQDYQHSIDTVPCIPENLLDNGVLTSAYIE